MVFRVESVSDDELETIGIDLGADVPFFIKGKTQIGDGIGEILKPIETIINGYYLLVAPDLQIDTKWAYDEFKNISNGK